MRGLLRLIGRMALVIILLVSAYSHLKQPQSYTNLYKSVYPSTLKLTNKYGLTFLPTAQAIQPHWKLIAKVIGMFEGVSALLIFFGDHLGAVFYLGSLIVGLVARYGAQIMTVMNWTKAQHIQLSNAVIFIGLAMVMYAYQHQIAVQAQNKKKLK